MIPRWEAGSRVEGTEAFAELWKICGNRRTLVVVGAGFDPRTPVLYEQMVAAAPLAPDVVLVGLEGLNTGASTDGLAAANLDRLRAAADMRGAVFTERASTNDGAASAGMVTARDFFSDNVIDGYEQLVVDISALPRSVFFPLIRGLLQLYDAGSWTGDLHVVACENHRIDRLVIGEGAEAPGALAGFADHTPEAEQVTRIWVPVLGEGEGARLDALWDNVRPAEVCPVLPFPASDPRRCDDLLREYRELLFEVVDVEPRNFIYAAESNPYDVYRTLSALDERYRQALSPLGETRMILSTHSSKLLSIGVLLAAYEQGLEVRHVSPTRYGCDDLDALVDQAEHNLVVDLWLTGEPYA